MRVELYDNGVDYEVRWYFGEYSYSIEGIYGYDKIVEAQFKINELNDYIDNILPKIVEIKYE